MAVAGASIVSRPAGSPGFGEIWCDILDATGVSWYELGPPEAWFEGNKETLQLVAYK